MPSTSTDPINNWIKFQTFLDVYPEFSSHQMRWLMLHRNTNGLDKHVKRVGKGLYISRSGFAEWLGGTES